MFLEILLFSLLGIGAGTVTGIIPGLHPNTLFIIVVSFISVFSGFPLYAVLAFIISLGVSNTFTDFLPSLFLSAPEESNSLSTLPGHEMLLEGRGQEALFLTVVGGLGVTLLTAATLPLLVQLIPFLYNSLSSYIHYLLIAVSFWMVVTDKKAALFVFLASGLFGFISLETVPSVTVIFPALTGMFGFSNLLMSIKAKPKIPKQKECSHVEVSLRGIFTGWVSGLLVGILPGIGSSQAGVVSSQILKTKPKHFLTALGGINTANVLFTFVMFFTLEKTRSGVVWAISQILFTPSLKDLLLIMIIGAITAFVSAVVTIKVGKCFLKFIQKVDYVKLSYITMLCLFVLVFAFTGLIGLFISIIGTFIGLSTILLGAKRSNMMAFFIVPTILYFAGLNPLFAFLFGF
ncbi:MAG TPA: tripartite tricarboxylate transporter permease [archaeon]|nr:tripartite tricarboxylate transporter permease [archaeon]